MITVSTRTRSGKSAALCAGWLALLGSAGCATRLDEGLGRAPSDLPEMQLGTGETAFAPLHAGDEIALIRRPDGGYLLFAAVRLINIGIEGHELVVTATRASDGEQLARFDCGSCQPDALGNPEDVAVFEYFAVDTLPVGFTIAAVLTGSLREPGGVAGELSGGSVRVNLYFPANP